MTPGEARTLLLDQHAGLRVVLDRVRALASQVLAGDPSLVALHGAVADLRERFDAHNHDELALLEPILREGDAWAPARIARMLEEHAAEHQALVTLLDAPGDLAAVIADFAEELEAHMAAEERTFLSAGVLRDRG